jgi:transcription antitermination protein NusB
MINRRLIRIKTFQSLFGDLENKDTRPSQIQNNIKKSITGMEMNFMAVLSFVPELAHFISTEHNPKDFKFNTSQEDLKSFEIFTNNLFIKQLEKNETLANYLSRPKLNWSDEKEVLFIIYKEIKKTQEFNTIIHSELKATDFVVFSKFIYKHLLLDSVEFEQLMEEKNIYWYDEKIPILKGIEKIFEEFKTHQKITMPPFFKNEKEDLAMADDLVALYFEHKSELENSISEYTPDWDNDRITKIDYILMLMASIELRYMPLIPVKVTLNEYIEIAKMYSTPKSSKFINGTLDKILHDWKKRDLIHKKGRGLIG